MNNHYRPSTGEEYMNNSQLQYFKAKLLAMQQDYSSTSIVRLNALNKGNKEADLDNGLCSSGLTDVDILNEDNHAYMQKEISDALEHIKDGSYGYCEDTGEEIGVKRLMANLVARHCIATQERHDRKKKIMYKLHGNEQ